MSKKKDEINKSGYGTSSIHMTQETISSICKNLVDYGRPFITIQDRGLKRKKSHAYYHMQFMSKWLTVWSHFDRLNTDSFLNTFYQIKNYLRVV